MQYNRIIITIIIYIVYNIALDITIDYATSNFLSLFACYEAVVLRTAHVCIKVLAYVARMLYCIHLQISRNIVAKATLCHVGHDNFMLFYIVV